VRSLHSLDGPATPVLQETNPSGLEAEAAFEDFITDLNKEMRVKNPWQNCSPPSLMQSNKCLRHLRGSHQNSFEFLDSFLSQTHHNSQAAAVIGVHTLVQCYLPFFGPGGGGTDDERVSLSLALHFSRWLRLMEPSTRPKQILTFLHTIFHQTFQANLTPLLALYRQILAEVVTIDAAASQTIEEEETPQSILSVFVLTAVQSFSDWNQATLASQLLLEALAEGLSSSSSS
jgi:hypothetical protein